MSLPSRRCHVTVETFFSFSFFFFEQQIACNSICAATSSTFPTDKVLPIKFDVIIRRSLLHLQKFRRILHCTVKAGEISNKKKYDTIRACPEMDNNWAQGSVKPSKTV